LTKNENGDPMFLEEKNNGKKMQYLPFLLSRNMRKYTSKNTGFCPNKVIHIRLLIYNDIHYIILEEILDE